MTRENL